MLNLIVNIVLLVAIILNIVSATRTYKSAKKLSNTINNELDKKYRELNARLNKLEMSQVDSILEKARKASESFDKRLDKIEEEVDRPFKVNDKRHNIKFGTVSNTKVSSGKTGAGDVNLDSLRAPDFMTLGSGYDHVMSADSTAKVHKSHSSHSRSHDNDNSHSSYDSGHSSSHSSHDSHSSHSYDSHSSFDSGSSSSDSGSSSFD